VSGDDTDPFELLATEDAEEDPYDPYTIDHDGTPVIKVERVPENLPPPPPIAREPPKTYKESTKRRETSPTAVQPFKQSAFQAKAGANSLPTLRAPLPRPRDENARIPFGDAFPLATPEKHNARKPVANALELATEKPAQTKTLARPTAHPPDRRGVQFLEQPPAKKPRATVKNLEAAVLRAQLEAAEKAHKQELEFRNNLHKAELNTRYLEGYLAATNAGAAEPRGPHQRQPEAWADHQRAGYAHRRNKDN
jgi:hypothetical protein